MSLGGNSALKFIAATGVAAFAFLLIASFALRKSLRPNEAERVRIHRTASAFDAKRAYADLEAIVAFGPRPPGSEALERTRAYIRTEVSRAGLELREDRFKAETPAGEKEFVNVTAIVKGTRGGVILVGNHYDTKYLPDTSFIGANDGGSTTAWMIEMARVLGKNREGRSIWLVWFDGEEALGEWSATDSLYGSRHMVEQLKLSGKLAQIHAMINVDMIGDCYLNIHHDPDAPAWLSGIVWDSARRFGYGPHFAGLPRSVEDDHVPFRREGVPALELIDFIYGGSILNHARNWHTEHDTIEKVCSESLQAVADVLLDALPGIDAHLDMMERRAP